MRREKGPCLVQKPNKEDLIEKLKEEFFVINIAKMEKDEYRCSICAKVIYMTSYL